MHRIHCVKNSVPSGKTPNRLFFLLLLSAGFFSSFFWQVSARSDDNSASNEAESTIRFKNTGQTGLIAQQTTVAERQTPETGKEGGSSVTHPVELKGPSAQDRHITRVVALLLRQQHLLNDPLDDDHARRGLENFLKALDYMKVYFNQGDVDEFILEQDSLDDRLKRGDIRFAYKVFHRFLERVNERVSWVDQIIAMEHDFEIEEEIVTDPDGTHYPTDENEAFDRWRRRIKYDFLRLKADEIEGEEARQRLHRRYTNFQKRMHQTDSDELLEMYLTAMTTGFDPHTTFMSASTLDNFHITMRLKLEGIGAALSLNDGYTVVNEVIPGGAADKHGKVNTEEKLEVEDRIVSVGQGEDGEIVDVIDMKLSDVVKLIRGSAGTIVRLGVQKGGRGETKIFTITRAKIELKDKEARGEIFEAGRKPDGSPHRIGAILLTSFYMDMTKKDTPFGRKSTTRDVRRILEDFQSKEVDAVVVDLRRNGGGSLSEAIGVTGLFIEQGPVVQVMDSRGNVQDYKDLDLSIAWGGPLVVLTSKFSASASEIFAGAIQDYKRGLVVGDSATHGKGTVQSLVELGPRIFPIPNARNLGALKVTMQQFYRPNGDSTQKRGVLADVVIPHITDHFDIAESDLDYALNFGQVPRAEYKELPNVSEELVTRLRELSLARRSASEDFDKAKIRIKKYLEYKKQTALSIQEEKFFARLTEIEEEEEETKKAEKNTDLDKAIERDYYFEEVLDITVDYLEQLKNHRVVGVN